MIAPRIDSDAIAGFIGKAAGMAFVGVVGGLALGWAVRASEPEPETLPEAIADAIEDHLPGLDCVPQDDGAIRCTTEGATP